MNLHFKSITVANWFSYGNVPTTIQLDSHPITAIIAKNGAGKSSIIADGVCFALSNKPYRPITKPLLVNSINRKNCMVELVFTKGLETYKIRRGIKPNIFEIYRNEVLLNPPTDTRDYQAILEEQILEGFSFKTFSQVVMLGTAGFKPFLELVPEARRDVVETILDIGVFSTMNEHNKVIVSKLKQEEREHSIKVKERDAALVALRNIQLSLNQDLSNKRKVLDDDVAGLTKDVKEIDALLEGLQNKVDSLSVSIDKFGNVSSKLSKYSTASDMLKDKSETIQKSITEYESMDTCQTCMQAVSDDQKSSLTLTLKTKQDAIVGELCTISGHIELLEDAATKLQRLNNDRSTLESSMRKLHQERISLSSSINVKKQELTKLQRPVNVEDVTQKVDTETKSLEVLVESYEKITSSLAVAVAAGKALNDAGVKARIIKEYIPVLNHLINKNLDLMDLFIAIELNEQFDVTFKSRHRDAFQYASFSEGQKARINIAILFAWRDLAKLKNSVVTNLLILDEIFSSAIDENGTDQLQGILSVMEDVNVFVISHNAASMLEGFADRTLHMKLVNNFTEVTES